MTASVNFIDAVKNYGHQISFNPEKRKSLEVHSFMGGLFILNTKQTLSEIKTDDQISESELRILINKIKSYLNEINFVSELNSMGIVKSDDSICKEESEIYKKKTLEKLNEQTFKNLNKNDLLQIIQKIVLGVFHEKLIAMDIKYRSDFSLPSQDFVSVSTAYHLPQVSYETYSSKKTQTECHGYTLYHMHEERYLNFIFKSGTGFIPESFSELKNWISLGYELIREPQAGDMALYLKTNPYPFPCHFGVCVGNGEVISKLGKDLGVYLHDIENVKLGYGDSIVYLRKRYKSTVLKNAVDDLNQAQSQEHPSWAAGNAEGAKHYWKNYFTSKFQEKTTLTNSLLGNRYHSFIETEIDKQISQLDTTGRTIKDVNLKIKDLVLSVNAMALPQECLNLLLTDSKK